MATRNEIFPPRNIAEDREKGVAGEKAFIGLLTSHDHQVTKAHPQFADSLPWCTSMHESSHGDVAFIDDNGLHSLAEVKRKYPTDGGNFGLEEYRWHGLVEGLEFYDNILYAIFDTNTDEWLIADLDTLWKSIKCGHAKKKAFKTWRNSKWVEGEPGWLWPRSVWSTDLSRWISKPKIYNTARYLAVWKWRSGWAS